MLNACVGQDVIDRRNIHCLLDRADLFPALLKARFHEMLEQGILIASNDWNFAPLHLHDGRPDFGRRQETGRADLFNECVIVKNTGQH